MESDVIESDVMESDIILYTQFAFVSASVYLPNS